MQIRIYELEQTLCDILHGMGMILINYSEIITKIRKIGTLRKLWEKYSRNYEHAKGISFDDTCNTVQTIM